MIDEATGEYVAIAKEEIEGGYSDAMLSMERTEATGRLCGLQEAYFVFFNEPYHSESDFDPQEYEDSL